MPLGLHETPHHPKGTEQVPIGVCSEAWNNGVVGPLVGGYTVGMLLIKDEVVAPILQHKSAAFWYYACDTVCQLHAGVLKCLFLPVSRSAYGQHARVVRTSNSRFEHVEDWPAIHGVQSATVAQHSTAQHSTAQPSPAQHSTAQHSTAQHSTAQTCAKAHVIGVDEAACIAFTIHYTKVHSVCASSVRVYLHIMARVSR